MAIPIIRANQVEKYSAQPSENRIEVIAPTDLEIVPDQIVALLGPSGSGRSTLLRMLTGLSQPSAGQVYPGMRKARRRSEHGMFPSFFKVLRCFRGLPFSKMLKHR